MNSLNSMHTYNYNKMRSVSSSYNTAGIKKSAGNNPADQAQNNSYVNNSALSYLAGIKNSASQLLESLQTASNSTAFNKMQAASANNSVLTVNESSKPTVAFADTQDEVQQAATVQVNEDTGLNEGKDLKAQTDAVNSVVDGFNNLLSAAKSGPQNNRLLNDLNIARNSYSSSLEKIGITSDKDGKLQINAEKLGKAAEDGTLGSFFAPKNGANYGFTSRLTRITENVSGNVSAYNYSSNAATSGSNQSKNQNVLQNAINSYKQNMNNYAYSYNAPGVLYNRYA